MGIMLEILIWFAIFSLLLKIVDRPLVKKIKNAENVDAAIGFKKELITKRKRSLGIFVGFVILFRIVLMLMTWTTYTDDYMVVPQIISLVVFIVILFVYVEYSNKNNKYLGDLSVEKAADFLKEDSRFVLYLRGFESDVYNDKDVGKYDFSEDVLASVVKIGLGSQLCAIGMTKEVNCPLGGRRVYVEDEKWELEVMKMMEKAEKIVCLVNDRQSCVWEIEKSKEVYDKCVFVVDDLVKYDNAKKTLDGVVDMPDIPASDVEDLSLEYDPRRFYFGSDNVMKPFDGEVSDYCEILGLKADAVTEDDIKKCKKQPFYTRPFFIFLMMLAAARTIAEIIELFE